MNTAWIVHVVAVTSKENVIIFLAHIMHHLLCNVMPPKNTRNDVVVVCVLHGQDKFKGNIMFCVYKQQEVINNEYNTGCRCKMLCTHYRCVGSRYCTQAFLNIIDEQYGKDRAKQCRACLRKTRTETRRQKQR